MFRKKCHPEDGGSIFSRNFIAHLEVYTVAKATRRQFEVTSVDKFMFCSRDDQNL